MKCLNSALGEFDLGNHEAAQKSAHNFLSLQCCGPPSGRKTTRLSDTLFGGLNKPWDLESLCRVCEMQIVNHASKIHMNVSSPLVCYNFTKTIKKYNIIYNKLRINQSLTMET